MLLFWNHKIITYLVANKQLNNELDTFVDTNEKARNNLNRRDHVEYIKNKNREELTKSIDKVRKSRSPERTGY